MKKYFLILASSLLLMSCGKNKVFEKFVKFENYDWKMDQILKFDVPVEDTSAAYDVSIPVRHTDNYPYDALLVNVTYYAPNGEMHTKNYKLSFRDSTGKFIGDAAGDIWDEKVVIMKQAKFNAKGVYKFEIENNMPTTPTQGSMEAGLLMEKAE